MPTKMNKVRQQLYVPSGEDGGEYRQYGYGGNGNGNVGETKKGKKELEGFGKKKEEDKIQVDIKDGEKNAKDFEDFVNNSLTKNSKEFNEKLIDNFKVGKNEGHELLNKVVKEGNISYKSGSTDCCYLASGGVVLTATGLGGTKSSENYEKGNVFWHETYHAIDGNFIGEDVSKGWKLHLSASESVITSNGKTLCETLKGRMKPPIKERLEQAEKDLKEWKENWYKKNAPDQAKLIEKDSEYEREVKEIVKNDSQIKELNQQADAIRQELISLRGSDEKYSNLRDKFYDIRNKMRTKEYEIRNSYKAEERKALREKIFNAESECRKAVNRTWGDVSDMFCLQGYGYVFGMGHGSSYAKKDTNMRGREFFAECGAAENTNPESLKLIKKYFPDGYRAYRDIIDGIKSGKYQTNKTKAKRRNK